MPLETLHNVDDAIQTLLGAPGDIEGGTPLPEGRGMGALGQAHPKLRKMFETYREGYQFLYPTADQWWRDCVAARERPGRTHEEAVREAFEVRAAGPASAPEFVWFVRFFWFACDDIIKSLPLRQRVAPEIVLLKWLADAGERDAVTLLTSMPYWPIGLDEQGEWC